MTKSQKHTTGVYCIYNTANGKRYVGSAAKSLVRRFRDHRYQLNHSLHHNKHLQSAWDYYGSKAFRFQILERCNPRECVQREQTWIDKYQCSDRRFGYNKSPTAGSPLGFRHTKQTKAKVSLALKGKKKTRQHADRIRDAKQAMSLTTKRKMSEYAKHRTASHQRKLAKAMLGNQNGLGRQVSQQTRQVLAEKAKQRWDLWRASGKIVEIGNQIAKGHQRAKERKLRSVSV